ncbi:TIGR00730 family Rossman fold protein [Beijerinckia indica]|uniref:Cytokinin riboside 5'-monophosphate phosphoribohydrolase n=1 Tax=Beijerinckia indica subsp. indica (strain ATCC 9039 / DSM 1715 / NCIMB 8712) TaxID=395963 RepID=B2IED7_BEII9|nr:TIGR00730 family Rossman fold protein [Beijerinckia indica]ACB95535.1 conserved hypothetical protein [Beijerinckia indica subsp. indica ATCC 9039]
MAFAPLDPDRSKPRRICVYCGSAKGSDARYVDAAEQFGTILADAGIGLVYGGGGNGLMGVLARAVLAGGGHVTGIIPDFLQSKEKPSIEIQDHRIVDDMHTRKRLMFEEADAFVALPGGIGTLEELVEQLTWVQLERHTKPVVLADIGGFWQPLLSLFAHMRQQGFIPSHYEIRYLVAERIEDIVPMIEQAMTLNARLGKNKQKVDPRL